MATIGRSTRADHCPTTAGGSCAWASASRWSFLVRSLSGACPESRIPTSPVVATTVAVPVSLRNVRRPRLLRPGRGQVVAIPVPHTRTSTRLSVGIQWILFGPWGGREALYFCEGFPRPTRDFPPSIAMVHLIEAGRSIGSPCGGHTGPTAVEGGLLA